MQAMTALPVMPLEAVKMRGTIDVALRIKNYLQSMMRGQTPATDHGEPKLRSRWFNQNPSGNHDLVDPASGGKPRGALDAA